jgi:phage shock protein PspC (stress-responsive transcriptional regulator)
MFNRLIQYIKSYFERQAFGVCEWMGEWMGIRSSEIRKYFIYTSFLTIGSPVIVYLFMAFWMNVKKLIRQKRGGVWDL